MKVSKEKLKKLLVDPGHVKEEDFDAVVLQAKEDEDLADLFIAQGFIQENQLGQLIAEDFGWHFVKINEEEIAEDVFHFIPELVMRSKRIVAFRKDKDGIHVGMLDPSDLDTIHALEKRTGESVKPYLMTESDFRDVLARFQTSLQDEIKGLLAKISAPSIGKDERDELRVQIIDTLLRYAFLNKSSDIHIEPHRMNVLVRFRIDGVMHDVIEFPLDLADYLVTRVKIMARMRTDEHRAAQDGRFRFTVEEEDVDVRVSVVPVSKGENVVMRLLSAAIRGFTLANIGLSEQETALIVRVARSPRGMLLVAGPTGSGKTTTVYAIMKIINRRDVHIASIEDPVEYDIEGISQIQVDPKTNLTFAQGLRAIVRQDPDIIMVGEIRDKETAGIAVNSAMTGHLVLSTLHADDAATTAIRFTDMGVEPFLVASTVKVVVAQRLARKICTDCRVSYELTEEERARLVDYPVLKELFEKTQKTQATMRLYHGQGCALCGDTGYRGRMGIFEVMEVSEVIQQLILAHASHNEITKVAREQGMRTLLESGIEKVLSGITTLEELFRVVTE
jgi:type IV pilus assembly protein PilB